MNTEYILLGTFIMMRFYNAKIIPISLFLNFLIFIYLSLKIENFSDDYLVSSIVIFSPTICLFLAYIGNIWIITAILLSGACWYGVLYDVSKLLG